MKKLNELIQKKFQEITETGLLFVSEISGTDVWELYLQGFGNDPKFRDPESSVHNCNQCNNFIRRYGNIVGIDKDYNIVTMFDLENVDIEYANSMMLIAKMLKQAPVNDIFFETYQELNVLPYEKNVNKQQAFYKLGIESNVKRYTKEEAEKYGVVKPNETRRFYHFNLNLPNKFVDTTGNSYGAIASKHRSNKEVFKRALDTIPIDTYKLVKDLINQGSLLDGKTHLSKVETMIKLKGAYDKVSANKQDNWCWRNSFNLAIAKFRNELIGTLCTELAEGEELNKACQSWNKRVDPANYMKAKAPITQTQINNAKKFVEENGYVESFDRRPATIDDIKVSEIKHINVGDGTIKKVSIFDDLLSGAKKSSHARNKFDKVEEVTIDKFMKEILPECSSVELLLENKFENNLVVMTLPTKENSKPIFKWDNNYSWTYKGNLAGKSLLTERVKAAGGKVDGVFRFTHSWNELEPNMSLMDLHVFMPGHSVLNDGIHDNYGSGRRIGWNKRQDLESGGVQDVDYTQPAPKGYIPVENITFPDINKMPEGKYVCKIHNWAFRISGGKGSAEISLNGEIYQYTYPATKNKEWITIAEVTLKNGQFTIEHKLECSTSSKKIYNLDTQEFHKVNLMCLSPNHWGDNAIGNKHYFFMLDKCMADEEFVGFHTENLNSELVQHRKVIEVLSMTSMIKPTKNQLAGVGFNATIPEKVTLRLKGNFNRMVKVVI